jgi:hypothetical protein
MLQNFGRSLQGLGLAHLLVTVLADVLVLCLIVQFIMSRRRRWCRTR